MMKLIPTKNNVLLRETLPSWRARGAQVWSTPVPSVSDLMSDMSRFYLKYYMIRSDMISDLLVWWLIRAAQVWSAASGEKAAEGSNSVRRPPMAGETMRRLHNSENPLLVVKLTLSFSR